MNPNTTFTELSQPPLLGILLSSEGKRAKMVKGSAKARLKASMVIMGVQNSPWVLFISTVPTIGPVQLKLTSTRVRARKNTPASPFLSLLRSALLVHLEGMVISNAPKKLAAKTMNTRKKIILGSQCVDSQLNMSAVTPLPPTTQVMPMMREMGTVYSRTMKSPYMVARKRPFAGFSLPFKKKEMVMGTMGKTQGVKSMAKPQSMASSISPQSPPEDEDSSPAPELSRVATFWTVPAPLPRAGTTPAALSSATTSNSHSSGILHWVPSQVM